MGRQDRRTVHRQSMIAATSLIALATVCTTTELRVPIELRSSSQAVELVAAIDDSPTTVGLADSNLMRLDDIDLINKQLDMMQSIGVQNVRVGISWLSTQLANGDFVWDNHKIDYVINEAHERGMGILAVLHETPGWARLDPDNTPPMSGMPDPTKFGAFAGAVAEKYEGKISAIEIWNEPNGRPFLNPVDPTGYTNMLKAAYDEIKAYDDPDDPDDDITVIAGVLGSGVNLNGGTLLMNPTDYLAGMYAAGAHGFFDAISFHPYKNDMKFSDQENQRESPMLQLREMRAMMDSYGDAALKIWATEYGLPTVPSDAAMYQKQADFIADFLANWQKEDRTGPIFIYSARDLDTGTSEQQDNFGIWETDWDAKPAVQVIRDFIAGLGPVEPGHPILDAIKNLVRGLAQATVAVINGVVDLVVDVVDAVIDATVWVVKTIAEVTVNVVQGLVDLTSWVVHGIADAIVTSVNWVVDKIQDCFGNEESAPAQNRMAATATVSTLDELAAVDDGAPEPTETDTSDGRADASEQAEPAVAEPEVVEPAVEVDETPVDETPVDETAPDETVDAELDQEVSENDELEITDPESGEEPDLTTTDEVDEDRDTLENASTPDAETDSPDPAGNTTSTDRGTDESAADDAGQNTRIQSTSISAG
ncbi:cellulase family glycosylhydrolase [Mycobacterium sp. AMU20-3851]|uniref:cellulase family glycosylhydrolase n=1 Tax=Mycobacterium sp. AMU20-3851 TaxID=3122055 RepID=UPI0037550C67